MYISKINVFFYTKFNLSRKVAFPKATSNYANVFARCKLELELARACPFASDLDLLSYEQPVPLERIIHIAYLVDVLCRRYPYLKCLDDVQDTLPIDTLGYELNLPNPREVLRSEGIFVKNGEIHVEYRGR